MGVEPIGNGKARRWEACRYDEPGPACIYKTSGIAWLSQVGNAWEYYHFLVDFMPRLLFAMERDGCLPPDDQQSVASPKTTVLRVPGWPPHSKVFSFDAPWRNRSMLAHARAIFGARATFRFEHMGAEPLCKASGRFLPFPPGMFEWGQQPKPWLFALRRRVFAMAHIRATDAAPHGVLLVRRQSQGVGADPKAHWRRLPAAFFVNASIFLVERGLPHRVVELEGRPLFEQARIFASHRLVVAAHGAALANILFSPTHAGVLEVGIRLFKPFPMIAQRLGLHYHYAKTHGFDDHVQRLIMQLWRRSQGSSSNP